MAKTLPAKKKRGRPPIDPSEETQPIALRLTAAQRAKLARLGGPPWVRERIDKTREPND